MTFCTHRDPQAGFSLLEVLAVLSLLALLMSLLCNASNSWYHQWHHLEERQKSSLQASLLLQEMRRDLDAAAPVAGSFFVNLTTVDPRARKNIFFLSTRSSLKHPGELHAIGYFFIQEKNSPSHNDCYRFEASLEETQEALEKQNFYTLFSKASATNHTSSHHVCSDILSWSFQPLWLLKEKISSTPPETWSDLMAPPNLLEITFTREDHSLRECSEDTTKIKTFSTVV
jgi:prepilin-type N-terminal cleavage/methylation domain-containing protein